MLIDPKDLPSKEMLEEFFFEVMNTVGYASGNFQPQQHPLIKGWKTITRSVPLPINHFGGAQLVFSDSWSKESGRTTLTIRFEDIPASIPLWVMRYEGSYTPKAIIVLKKVLHDTYKQKRFCGGRGNGEREVDGLFYRNVWWGEFDQFGGLEKITKKPGVIEGEEGFDGGHKYWGGILVPLPRK